MLDITAMLIGLEFQTDESNLIMVPIVGLGLPTPQGQVIPIPLAALRLGMSKEVAVKQAEAMLEAANALPDAKPQSDLIVANNMSTATQAAKLNEQFRGPQR